MKKQVQRDYITFLKSQDYYIAKLEFEVKSEFLLNLHTYNKKLQVFFLLLLFNILTQNLMYPKEYM